MRSASLVLALLPALALADAAKPPAVFSDLKSGKAESVRTGKPIFLATLWPPGC
jgi:hypothetical protein